MNQAHDNPLTDAERRLAIERHRGRHVSGRLFRNFCAKCCVPMLVDQAHSLHKHMLCEDCGGTADAPPPEKHIGGQAAMKDDTDPAFENVVRAMEEQ